MQLKAVEGEAASQLRARILHSFVATKVLESADWIQKHKMDDTSKKCRH